MTQAQHDQARRELGFPTQQRVEPHHWPDMEQSLLDDEAF